jgi:hypothetical protein
MTSAGSGYFSDNQLRKDSMKKTAKKAAAAKQMDKFGTGAAVAVEVPLGDGSVSMLTGRIVSKDKESIVLSSAALVKDTGRRTQFFAGAPDSNCEIEVYADDVQIPAHGAFLYAWPHPLPTVQR